MIKVYLGASPEHLSGAVGAGAAGCLCFPQELKQMSAETPALVLAQPPPPLPAGPGYQGVTTLPQNTHIPQPPGMLLS